MKLTKMKLAKMFLRIYIFFPQYTFKIKYISYCHTGNVALVEKDKTVKKKIYIYHVVKM